MTLEPCELTRSGPWAATPASASWAAARELLPGPGRAGRGARGALEPVPADERGEPPQRRPGRRAAGSCRRRRSSSSTRGVEAWRLTGGPLRPDGARGRAPGRLHDELRRASPAAGVPSATTLAPGLRRHRARRRDSHRAAPTRGPASTRAGSARASPPTSSSPSSSRRAPTGACVNLGGDVRVGGHATRHVVGGRDRASDPSGPGRRGASRRRRGRDLEPAAPALGDDRRPGAPPDRPRRRVVPADGPSVAPRPRSPRPAGRPRRSPRRRSSPACRPARRCSRHLGAAGLLVDEDGAVLTTRRSRRSSICPPDSPRRPSDEQSSCGGTSPAPVDSWAGRSSPPACSGASRCPAASSADGLVPRGCSTCTAISAALR